MSALLGALDAELCLLAASSVPRAFKRFLAKVQQHLGKPPPRTAEAFRRHIVFGGDALAHSDMLEDLCSIGDLSTEAGIAVLSGLARRASIELPTDPAAPLVRMALAAYCTCPDVFRLAHRAVHRGRKRCFSLFRGREQRRPVVNKRSLQRFKDELDKHLACASYPSRAVARPYMDGDVIAIVVYHENLPQTESVLQGSHRILQLVRRPLAQECVAYHLETGLVGVESCTAECGSSLLQAFAAACFDDEELFSPSQDDRPIFDFSALEPDSFRAGCFGGVRRATVTRLVLTMPDNAEQKLVIESTDALADARSIGVPLGGTVRRAQVRLEFTDGGLHSVDVAAPNVIMLRRCDRCRDIREHLHAWGIMRT